MNYIAAIFIEYYTFFFCSYLLSIPLESTCSSIGNNSFIFLSHLLFIVMRTNIATIQNENKKKKNIVIYQKWNTSQKKFKCCFQWQRWSDCRFSKKCSESIEFFFVAFHRICELSTSSVWFYDDSLIFFYDSMLTSWNWLDT